MKKYTFKYSAILWALIACLVVISTAGLIYNIFNLVKLWSFGVSNIIAYLGLAFINLFLLVFVITFIFLRCYYVDDKYLFTRLGFLKFKSEIKEITQITHFEKQKKLVVYFADAKYSVIIIDEKYYEDFFKAIKDKNSSVYYFKQSGDFKENN